jgi:hypothetical protein
MHCDDPRDSGFGSLSGCFIASYRADSECKLGAQMVDCSLRLAGFEPDDGFRRYEALLAAAVIYSGPYEPPAAGDATAVQQAVRQHSVQYSLGWHGGGDAGKLAFMQDAMRLPHPANHEHDREAHGYFGYHGYLHLGSISDTGYFGYFSITHTDVCVILALGWYPQYRIIMCDTCHPGPPAQYRITFVCTLS